MSYSPDAEPGIWAALGPDPLLEMLVPLRDEHLRTGDAKLIPGDSRDIERVARTFGRQRGTLLVVEDPTHLSDRPRCGSPFLERFGGPDVLLGWIRLGRSALATYAHRAAALLRRPGRHEQPIVLLGPRERRYLDLLADLERAAQSSPRLDVFRWSAERIRRGPVVDALRLGAAAILYTGHGSARGWFAYGGLGADAFAAGGAWADDHAGALMFSLACATGQPTAPAAAQPGFADGMIALGAAGAILAPLRDPLHEQNRVLAEALVRALADGHKDLSDILEAARSFGASLAGYAVMGDPALCAVSAAEAARRGALVFAPAADADLAPGIVIRGREKNLTSDSRVANRIGAQPNPRLVSHGNRISNPDDAARSWRVFCGERQQS